MRIILGGILVCSVFCLSAFAIIVTLFMDTDTFLSRGKDIVVAECNSLVDEGPPIRAVDVNILKVIKGTRKPGRLRIATIYHMRPKTTYMLYNLGGSALGTDFLAIPELSVVPLPRNFSVAELEGKEPKEQVQCMLSRRLYQVERELAPLLRQKKLLEKAVSDRQYEWYESSGPVKIGPIVECSTQSDQTGQIWLDLDGKRLKWSVSSPGKMGYFYFEKTGYYPRQIYWEFSPCNATRIEDLVGRTLKARFYGSYTPGRADTALGSSGSGSIRVSVGQVLLIRAIDDPQSIFVLQIVSQKQDQEHMSARYALIRQ
jgi:hypothetical protein